MTLYEMFTAAPGGGIAGCVLCAVGLLLGVLYSTRGRSKPRRLRQSVLNVDSDPDAPEVVVVGSGVLGSALAAVLARDGRRVVVVERDLSKPDRIVGELLQPGGRRALKELGLHDCLEDLDAHVIKGYVLHERRSGAEVHIPYPPSDPATALPADPPGSRLPALAGLAVRPVPAEGRAFHHGSFVSALRKAAMAEPNATYIEGRATTLIEEDGVIVGVRYKQNDSDEVQSIRAPLTVVADGCFSRFRKMLVSTSPVVRSHFIGLLMEDCPQSRPNHAEIVLPCEGSPILVYQISSHVTRVLVDVKGGMPRDVKAYLRDTVYPQMPDHLKEPFLDALAGRVRSMPNSFLPPAPVETPGALVLGDAFNMRHPLTGGGMTVAFNDVLLWRRLLRKVPDLRHTDAILDALREFNTSRKSHHSFVVDVLSMALYELFAADDEHLMKLKEACFAYFQLGGECVNGPVGLLSVLTPRPYLLVGHFVAVALYAVYFSFKAGPWWAVHRSAMRSAAILYRAAGIFVPLVWTQLGRSAWH